MIPNSSSYRPDIDGLRALAVLIVVGFHAEIAEFRGGFAGVDVFFVISGYLISGILLSALREGRFTFREFYVRRINRIFPALVAVLAATTLAGWWVLFPPEFETLGRHVAAGAGFVSNALLWSEAGYFDSKNKPLLHLWSLAVEEQFYLIWPALLVFAWKRNWSIKHAIAALTLASFFICVLTIQFTDRTLAFYAPFTRLWELLAGALLATTIFTSARLPSRSKVVLRELSAVLGLGLIAISTLTLNPTVPWPGWLTLLPVCGALLVIGPALGSRVSRVALASAPMVYVGRISYPLYLWHWPLLVFARIVNEGQIPRSGRVALVLTAFVLAAITYEIIEKPIRFGRRKGRYAILLVPTLALAGLVGFGLAHQVLRPRLFQQYAELNTSSDEMPHGAEFTIGGKIISPGIAGDTSRTLAVMGDSHATMYWPRLEARSAAEGNRRPAIKLLAYGGCPPLPGVNISGISWDGLPFRCDAFHRRALEFVLRPTVKTVMYSAYWEDYLDERLFFADDPKRQSIGQSEPMLDSAFRMFQHEVRQLKSAGKRVFIVLPTPNATANHPDLMMPRRLPGLTERPIRRTTDRAQMDLNTLAIRARLLRIGSSTGAVIIDPMSHLCDATTCRTVTSDGRAIYSDEHHLKPSFARDSASFIDGVFQY